MATNRRAQTRKARTGGTVVKSGNPEYVEAVQNLRRSSAASPHKSAKAYTRKPKNQRLAELDS